MSGPSEIVPSTVRHAELALGRFCERWQSMPSFVTATERASAVALFVVWVAHQSGDAEHEAFDWLMARINECWAERPVE